MAVNTGVGTCQFWGLGRHQDLLRASLPSHVTPAYLQSQEMLTMPPPAYVVMFIGVRFGGEKGKE